jgi:hypothetical protein
VITPVIKDIQSPDWNGEPDTAAEAGGRLGVELEIGKHDRPSADLFQLEIVPRPIATNQDSAFEWQGRTITMAHPSFQRVVDIVQAKIDALGPFEVWLAFAAPLAPFLYWEFKGMTYPPTE